MSLNASFALYDLNNEAVKSEVDIILEYALKRVTPGTNNFFAVGTQSKKNVSRSVFIRIENYDTGTRFLQKVVTFVSAY